MPRRSREQANQNPDNTDQPARRSRRIASLPRPNYNPNSRSRAELTEQTRPPTRRLTRNAAGVVLPNTTSTNHYLHDSELENIENENTEMAEHSQTFSSNAPERLLLTERGRAIEEQAGNFRVTVNGRNVEVSEQTIRGMTSQERTELEEHIEHRIQQNNDRIQQNSDRIRQNNDRIRQDREIKILKNKMKPQNYKDRINFIKKAEKSLPFKPKETHEYYNRNSLATDKPSNKPGSSKEKLVPDLPDFSPPDFQKIKDQYSLLKVYFEPQHPSTVFRDNTNDRENPLRNFRDFFRFGSFAHQAFGRGSSNFSNPRKIDKNEKGEKIISGGKLLHEWKGYTPMKNVPKETVKLAHLVKKFEHEFLPKIIEKTDKLLKDSNELTPNQSIKTNISQTIAYIKDKSTIDYQYNSINGQYQYYPINQYKDSIKVFNQYKDQDDLNEKERRAGEGDVRNISCKNGCHHSQRNGDDIFTCRVCNSEPLEMTGKFMLHEVLFESYGFINDFYNKFYELSENKTENQESDQDQDPDIFKLKPQKKSETSILDRNLEFFSKAFSGEMFDYDAADNFDNKGENMTERTKDGYKNPFIGLGLFEKLMTHRFF